MKQILLITFLSIAMLGYSQNDLEWDADYELQYSDFQSKSSQIGKVVNYSLNTGISMEFIYQMSAAKFMMTKNFNPYVSCLMYRIDASLVAPDSTVAKNLLNFARYEFDLTELYSRKFRMRLNEEKGAFSNSDFFQPVYDEIHEAYVEELSEARKKTKIGQNPEELEKLHNEVLKELELLSDYCFSCKPPKKKKK
jgi:hypothetical protein